jgi:DNA-binding CsgD family transcriptional regulator
MFEVVTSPNAAKMDNLFYLENKLATDYHEFKMLAESFPGFVHLNDVETYNLLFADKGTEEYFGMTTQEIIDLDEDFLFIHFKPYFIQTIIPNILKLGKKNDFETVYGYYSQVRQTEFSEFDSFLGLTKNCKQLNCYISIEIPLNIFNDFEKDIDKLFEIKQRQNCFCQKLNLLTNREIEILNLIGTGKKRCEIADKLYISKHTFDNHRKHIRQKLQIKSAAELFNYINLLQKDR